MNISKPTAEVTRVKWRSYDRASQIEREVGEWIVSLYPQFHEPGDELRASFSRQYLFAGDSSLQFLVIIPDQLVGLGLLHFYIIYQEGSDNAQVIGENFIPARLLYLHTNWVVNEARVLSSVSDDVWYGYIYNGHGEYLVNIPGRELPVSPSDIRVKMIADTRTPIAFRRKYGEMRDFERYALEAVLKVINYDEDEIRSLRVSAQYLSKLEIFSQPDVIFKIQSRGGDRPPRTYHELALTLEDGTYMYGGWSVGHPEDNQALFISKSDYFNGYYGLLHEVGPTEDIPGPRAIKYVFNGEWYQGLRTGEPEDVTVRWQQRKPMEADLNASDDRR
ncbi:hypothetical protein ACVW1A_002893 [Bradyrhizobium sp. LB1.3]